MARLGKRQLDKLAAIPISAAQICGCKTTRSLTKRGLMTAHGEDGDSWFSITPEGLEALAAAMRSGQCSRGFSLEKMKANLSRPHPKGDTP